MKSYTVAQLCIGSFMGGLYASTRDLEIMKKRAKVFSYNMSQLWRKIIDLTYPVIAMFSGKGMVLLCPEGLFMLI